MKLSIGWILSIVANAFFAFFFLSVTGHTQRLGQTGKHTVAVTAQDLPLWAVLAKDLTSNGASNRVGRLSDYALRGKPTVLLFHRLPALRVNL